MAGWGDILKEVTRSGQLRQGLGLGPDLDGIRQKYINKLKVLTGRAVIVYASGWLQSSRPGELGYSVQGADLHALMEVCREVPERELDLILHTPGGSPEAAEQMVNYLRTQFDDIRAIVPLQAKSAGTMIALGCDEVLMGPYSELGPIDPQIVVPVPEGQRFAPAHAILRDFERAKQDTARDVASLAAWTPILRGYAGGLIEFCTQQIALGQEIVAGWLERYMLPHEDSGIAEAERDKTAKELAAYFGSDEAYDRFKTHGRPIRIEELSNLGGLRMRELSGELQQAVLSIYDILDITFSGPCVKLVENHLGRRKVLTTQQIVIPGPGEPVPTGGPTTVPPRPPSQGGPNREQRRKGGR